MAEIVCVVAKTPGWVRNLIANQNPGEHWLGLPAQGVHFRESKLDRTSNVRTLPDFR